MERAKLGDVEISVTEHEDLTHTIQITEKAVEKGQNIVDHIKPEAPAINISGAIIGDDASDKLQQLKKYQKEGTLLKYVGRNVYSNMLIEEIGTTHEAKIRNGYEFNIKLKQARIVSAVEAEIKVKNPAANKSKSKAKTSTQVKKTTNNGTQQTQKKKTPEAAKKQLEEDLAVGNVGHTMDTIVKAYVDTHRKAVGGGPLEVL